MKNEGYEHKRIYIGPHNQPYAQDQINAAGREGWELVQIIGDDAWVRRRTGNEENLAQG